MMTKPKRHLKYPDLKGEMRKIDAIDLYKKINNLGIDIWIDGGWGVDALLGKQTRFHEDLDVVVQEKDVAKLRDHLERDGYIDIARDDTQAWNFVLGKDGIKLVDVHVIKFDEDGNGIYGSAKNGDVYPVKSLMGQGHIGKEKVKCLTASFQVESRSGYKTSEIDYRNVRALCEKFEIELPAEYSDWRK